MAKKKNHHTQLPPAVYWNKVVLTPALIRRMPSVSLQGSQQVLKQAAGRPQLWGGECGFPVPTPVKFQLL